MPRNLHQGHRDRMRKKFLELGLDKLEEHEMVEILLYNCIPYKDTNEIAHLLIEKFGNLAGILDASVEDLFDVKGMTKNAAILLSSMPDFFREYKKSKLEKNNPILNIDDILPLLEANLQYRDLECLFVICLDANQRITATVETGVSELTSVKFSTRAIADIALRYKAVNIIIAHNHPTGSAKPSEEDIALTIDLLHMFQSIGVELVDHIIIANHCAYSFFLKDEIREIENCKIIPYKMANEALDALPKAKVVKTIKQEDGTFQRLSK